MLSIKILAKSLHLYFYPSIFPIIVEEKNYICHTVKTFITKSCKRQITPCLNEKNHRKNEYRSTQPHESITRKISILHPPWKIIPNDSSPADEKMVSILCTVLHHWLHLLHYIWLIRGIRSLPQLFIYIQLSCFLYFHHWIRATNRSGSSTICQLQTRMEGTLTLYHLFLWNHRLRSDSALCRYLSI